MIKKAERKLKTSIATLIIFIMVISIANASIVANNNENFKIEIIGHEAGFFGENLFFTLNVSDGYVVDEALWYFGDGSMRTGGNPLTSHVTYINNEETNYTITVVAKDTSGNICYDTHNVHVMLSNVTISVDSFIKISDQDVYSKNINAKVGDILSIKIIAKVEADSLQRIGIFSENTAELAYVEDSASINPDIFHSGNCSCGEYVGPSLGWFIENVSSGESVVITFEVEVISEFCGDSYQNEKAISRVVAAAGDQDQEPGQDPGGEDYFGYHAWDQDFSLISIVKEYGDTLYVDAGGDAEYTRIQDAINAADPGDIVFVYNGIYKEDILVNKSITLKGENARETIIESGVGTGYNGIFITADDVTLEGFTIQFFREKGICVSSKDNKIVNNVLVRNRLVGISVENGNNIIRGNIILGSSIGILADSGYNLFKGNNLMKNDIGLEINLDCRANHVLMNIFMGNQLNAIDNNFYGNSWSFYNYEEDEGFRGNYWDDYTGEDASGEGIGDTPYLSIEGCNGGVILDQYPLVLKQPKIEIKIEDGTGKIKAELNNAGEIGASHVTWTISASGYGLSDELKGLVRLQEIDTSTHGIIDWIPASGSRDISSGEGTIKYKLGFMIIKVTAAYDLSNGDGTILTMQKALAMILNNEVCVLRAL